MATPDQHNNDTESPVQVDQVNQAVQTSRLLTLPAELRNRVYIFALMTDNGLIGHGNRSSLDLVVVTHNVRLSRQTFNKINFVCKQLWAESRMLELIYNTVSLQSLTYKTRCARNNASAGRLWYIYTLQHADSLHRAPQPQSPLVVVVHTHLRRFPNDAFLEEQLSVCAA